MSGAPRLPLVFRVAQAVRGMPDFPGRDTLLHFLITRDAHYPDALIQGTFGGGLRFEGNPVRDRNILELPLLRFARPALADLFDGVLGPGDVLADVGGNMGLYALWGARLVGPTGRVHSFEPVPESAAMLARNAELNGFEWLEVHACAVGAASGTVRLHRMDLYSGCTSRYAFESEHWIEAPLVTLDEHFSRRPPPRLVKIDVEGMEFEVLRGADRLLSGETPPLVVFEACSDFLRRAGSSYAEVLAYLAQRGHGVHALAPGGLRREPADAREPGSFNVLSARDGYPPHESALQRLRGMRFPENQST